MKYCDGCHQRKFCEWRGFTKQAHDGHFVPINCIKDGKTYVDGYYDGWVAGHQHASEEARKMRTRVVAELWQQLVDELDERMKART